MHQASNLSPHKLIEGKEEAVRSSWRRLLAELKTEVDRVRKAGPDSIPSIGFGDLKNGRRFKSFATTLKQHGAGVVSGVLPEDVALTWAEETRRYVSHNISEDLASACHNHEIFWSPAQVKARAHPNVLETQRRLMDLWHISEKDPLTPNFPIMYADKLHAAPSAPTNGAIASSDHTNGSCNERWEPEAASMYKDIWDGGWEDYDPWTGRKRLEGLTYGENTCSAVQLWQGLLCLEAQTATAPLRVCPMLRLSTAYVLLRPFFKPKHACPDHPEYLSADNWKLEPSQSSTLHGEWSHLRASDALHPHLCLSETLLPIALRPGDYLVSHPNIISRPQPSSNTTMSLPICPLTRTNALYLLRQRKAFLLGQPPPDFQHTGPDDSRWDGRLGVLEISETGGENALRAMGLAPWDEDDVENVMEAEVVEDANNVLFPDRHDFEMDWT